MVEVQFIGRETREPSPFSYELLNGNPYTFLDGAPLEERRTRAVATRRTLSSDELRDLATLDPAAIAQVRREAWPLVRSAEELHDALLSLHTIDAVEAAPWAAWLQDLLRAGRATRVDRPGQDDLWTAAEHWPVLAAAYPAAQPDPPVRLPERLQRTLERHAAITALVGGRIEHSGPATADEIAEFLGLPAANVAASLEALEGQGIVLRGNFTRPAGAPIQRTSPGRPVVRPAAAGAHSSPDARRPARSRCARSSPTSSSPSSRAIIAWLAATSGAEPSACARRSSNCKASSCRPAPGSSACWPRGSPNTIRPGSTTCSSRAKSCGAG